MPTIIANDTNVKLKNITKPNRANIHISEFAHTNVKFPFGDVIRPNRVGGLMSQLSAYKPKGDIKIPLPGEGLPRVIHYCADHSGCAFWRMIWPANELLAYNKAVVMTLYQMVTIGQFYGGIDAVRLQRQCTPIQLEFIKFLRQVSDEFKTKTGKGFRIIWEVDDLVLTDLIPNYNVCKTAFMDPNIEKTVKEAVHLCDEVTVVSPFMQKIYKDRLDYDRITVIPNYAPHIWLNSDYSREKVLKRYNTKKYRPRVLYAGSGTHFDVANRANQQDDFGHVIDAIREDITKFKKYEWVFFGAVPVGLQEFIGKGIEYHPWGPISDYTTILSGLNVSLCIAPLADNAFSRSKANIKLTEAGAQGIPCVAQNLDCYNSDGWEYLFDTVEDLFASMAKIMKTMESYMKASDFSRKYAEKFYLNDHLDEYTLLYTTGYGDPRRKENASFLRNNPDQFNAT